jgi:hypothetical protein
MRVGQLHDGFGQARSSYLGESVLIQLDTGLYHYNRYPPLPGRSVLSEPFEAVRRQFRVTNGVLDVLVPEVVLQRSRVMASLARL